MRHTYNSLIVPVHFESIWMPRSASADIFSPDRFMNWPENVMFGQIAHINHFEPLFSVSRQINISHAAAH
jgi:hypothetical protein